MGVAGLLLAFIIVPLYNYQKRNDRSGAVELIPQKLVDDHETNKARFRKNWVGKIGERKFVKFSGNVVRNGTIEDGFVIIETSDKVNSKSGDDMEFRFQCSNLGSEKFSDDISGLNPGDAVTVTAAIKHSFSVEYFANRKSIPGSIYVKAEKCSIEQPFS